MSRIETEKQARRDYILASSRRLFSERGLENCSMENIAVAAEYTRRTLYSYFKSRDELFLRIHLEDLAQRWARQQNALATGTGGLNRLRIWAEVLVAYSRDHPQALRMETFWDLHGIDRQRISPEVFKEFETLNDELAQGLRDLFVEGIADGSLRPDLEIDMAISQFLYSLRAVINRAFSQSYAFAEFDPDAYLRHFFDLLVRGISNSGESS